MGFQRLLERVRRQLHLEPQRLPLQGHARVLLGLHRCLRSQLPAYLPHTRRAIPAVRLDHCGADKWCACDLCADQHAQTRQPQHLDRRRPGDSPRGQSCRSRRTSHSSGASPFLNKKDLRLRVWMLSSFNFSSRFNERRTVKQERLVSHASLYIDGHTSCAAVRFSAVGIMAA
jgi:hypothetical protein